MAALPKIVEEIVSGVLGIVDGSCCYVIRHVFTANNSVIMRSITQVPL
jgi:hypothetical protein